MLRCSVKTQVVPPCVCAEGPSWKGIMARCLAEWYLSSSPPGPDVRRTEVPPISKAIVLTPETFTCLLRNPLDLGSAKASNMALTALLTWGDIPLSPALKEESPGEGISHHPELLSLLL